MLQTKLNENSNDDNRYRREVKVNINSYGQKYKGMEVSDVSAHSGKIYLNYLLNQSIIFLKRICIWVFYAQYRLECV